MDPTLFGATYEKITLMLESEGLAASQALDLCEKIVDYERNLAHQLACFRSVYIDRCLEPEELELSFARDNPLMADVESVLEEVRFLCGGFNRRAEAIVVKHGRYVHYRWMRYTKKKIRIQNTSAVRYLRRSTSQLLKALRRL